MPLIFSLWSNILGTTVSRGIAPLYNPGIMPFLLVAFAVPFIHDLRWQHLLEVSKDTVKMIGSAAVALLYAFATGIFVWVIAPLVRNVLS